MACLYMRIISASIRIEMMTMKKLFAILILLLLITGCGSRSGADTDEQAQIIDDMTMQLNRQALEIAELQDEVQSLTAHSQALEEWIAELDRQGEPYHPEEPDQPFRHGLTAAAVRENLMENYAFIRDVLGGEWIEIYEDEMLIGPQHVLVPVAVHAPYGEQIIPFDVHVFLFYHVRESGEILWRVQGHSWQTNPPAAGLDPWDDRYLPIDDDQFTMRFYIHRDWDQHIAIEETISRGNWREEVPQLMRTHSRTIDIRDLWYEGDRLYVDLFPVAAAFFNWGTTGSWLLTQTLIDSLGTLPGVAEIMVLVGGESGHWADHFSFVDPFIVAR